MRIDGLWKMSAIDLPASGVLRTPRDQARFCASAASMIMSSSVGDRSASDSRSRPLSDVSISGGHLSKNVGQRGEKCINLRLSAHERWQKTQNIRTDVVQHEAALKGRGRNLGRHRMSE